ncbi:MAG: glycosyltransferase, exosortase A system-associated [Halioglobus sp.]|nr:glycosyltransferase, exosortase A system-associated [Halioglobus sp.]
MKILHILDHSIPLHSGYTFRTRNILREQAALGWDTCHVTGLKQGEVSAPEEDVDGLHFYRTIDSGSLTGKLPIFNQLHVINTLEKRIGQVIEKEKPDILHAHSPALNGLAALRAARKHALPVVYECRAFWEDAAVDHGTSTEGGLRYRLTRSLETRVFRQADRVTTICEGLRQDIVQRGVPESRVTVIPNAVDISAFNMDSAPDESLRASLGLQGKTVLGFIGSFYAYEGLPLLLDALPRILAQVPEVVLLLVGGGPDEDSIRQRIATHGLEDAVIFTGRVPHAEVHGYYGLVDVFIYPRLPMRLTELVTPLKPLEAMAQGKLVLASDVGGHKELIRHGDNGYLFRAGSEADLAKTLVAALADREQWHKLRDSGRAYVENERNWRNSVGRYRDIYEALA